MIDSKDDELVQPSSIDAESDEQSKESTISLESDIRSIKKDLDQIVPSLLVALKRDRAFDELQKELRAAQRVAEAWRELPLATAIHEAILQMRQQGLPNDFAWIELMLLEALAQAGIEEFGLPGEEVTAEQVDIVEVSGNGERLVVASTKRPGLRISHIPLRKAIVEIQREG